MKVQELLKANGKDASWLHHQTKIAHSTISNWLTNPKDVQPKPSSVALVAHAFGVEIEELAPAAGYMIRVSAGDSDRARRRAAIVESRPRLARQIDRIGTLATHHEDTLLSMIESYLATIPLDQSQEESL
jgi:hypothetical protein